MSSLNLDSLPENDLVVYEEITRLSVKEKKLLWILIKHSSKDGYTIYTGEYCAVATLINSGLILENLVYQGKGRSFKILPHAPFLYRKLKSFKGNN
jgi:hypothetical protein